MAVLNVNVNVNVLQKSFVKSFRKISNWLHEINIYET